LFYRDATGEITFLDKRHSPELARLSVVRNEYMGSGWTREESSRWIVALENLDQSASGALVDIAFFIAERQGPEIIRVDLPTLRLPPAFADARIFEIVARSSADTHVTLSILLAGEPNYRRIRVDPVIYRWGWRVRTHIGRGDPISEAFVDRVVVDDKPLFDETVPSWYEASRDLHAGAIIGKDDVSKMTLVEARMEVKIIVTKSSAEVEVDGIALSAGGIGDKVSATTRISDTVVRGEVSGNGRIHVNIP